MGKGWAKGLPASTDQRVANAAAAHRGQMYTRRKPLEECRWPLASRTTLPLEWSDDMAYVVGLTATDGCLITGRRVINFKSQDRDLVQTYLSLLGRTNHVKETRTRAGGLVYHTQFHDAKLYEWFRSVGLTPRKSLTLGEIDVPDAFLVPLARGLMDGDGSIANFVGIPTRTRYPRYRYERLLVQFASASPSHIYWLRRRLKKLIGVNGRVLRSRREGRHDMYRLEFGKHASIALLRLFYSDPRAPRLVRKWRIWADFAMRTIGADGGSRTLMSFDTRS
jgi:hypothetical protein